MTATATAPAASPAKPLLTRERRLEVLNDQYREDPAFAHLRYRTRFVAGAGSVHPRIMFIGEAPGAEEEKYAKPFVGASGRLLNELLASIDLKREHCYITNVVKYRPPNNRDPRPPEVDASMAYLKDEMSVLKPDVVVTLGRFALNVFWPSAKITEVRGRVIPRGQQTFVPVMHPASALWNPGTRPAMFNDFQVIGNLV